MCHGPAALVSATDAEGGSIFKGKRVTCFTDKEEELAQKMEVRPRSLHMSRLKAANRRSDLIGNPFPHREPLEGARRHVRERWALGSEYQTFR